MRWFVGATNRSRRPKKSDRWKKLPWKVNVNGSIGKPAGPTVAPGRRRGGRGRRPRPVRRRARRVDAAAAPGRGVRPPEVDAARRSRPTGPGRSATARRRRREPPRRAGPSSCSCAANVARAAWPAATCRPRGVELGLGALRSRLPSLDAWSRLGCDDAEPGGGDRGQDADDDEHVAVAGGHRRSPVVDRLAVPRGRRGGRCWRGGGVAAALPRASLPAPRAVPVAGRRRRHRQRAGNGSKNTTRSKSAGRRRSRRRPPAPALAPAAPPAGRCALTESASVTRWTPGISAQPRHQAGHVVVGGRAARELERRGRDVAAQRRRCAPPPALPPARHARPGRDRGQQRLERGVRRHDPREVRQRGVPVEARLAAICLTVLDPRLGELAKCGVRRQLARLPPAPGRPAAGARPACALRSETVFEAARRRVTRPSATPSSAERRRSPGRATG